MMDIIVSAIIGGVAGAVYGLVNYFKRPEKENFDKVKFSSTVVISAIAGASIGYSGIIPESNDALQPVIFSLSAVGVDQMIEKVWKLIYRKAKK